MAGWFRLDAGQDRRYAYLSVRDVEANEPDLFQEQHHGNISARLKELKHQRSPEERKERENTSLLTPSMIR
jgi:hypothetical protein